MHAALARTKKEVQSVRIRILRFDYLSAAYMNAVNCLHARGPVVRTSRGVFSGGRSRAEQPPVHEVVPKLRLGVEGPGQLTELS